MNDITPNTRVIDLTLGELLDAIEQRIGKQGTAQAEQPAEGRNYVYGLRGIANLLGCSKQTAGRLKASGDYDDAITQVGALIVTDADKLLEIAKTKKHKF